MNVTTILTHPNEAQQIEYEPASLMRQLQELEALPRHELRREYYRIKPRLRYVSRELAQIRQNGA